MSLSLSRSLPFPVNVLLSSMYAHDCPLRPLLCRHNELELQFDCMEDSYNMWMHLISYKAKSTLFILIHNMPPSPRDESAFSACNPNPKALHPHFDSKTVSNKLFAFEW